jgi:endonuclease G
MYQKFTTTGAAAASSSKMIVEITEISSMETRNHSKTERIGKNLTRRRNFLMFFCAIVALLLISCEPPEVIVTKIKSMSPNEDFPGVYYCWHSEKNDSCFLKVADFVFDDYESFTLTLKRPGQTEDFVISLQDHQQMMADSFYKFQIPYAIGKKDLDSLCISNFKELTPAFVPVNNLEIPYTKEPEYIVSHTGFSLFFNDVHKQSDWVAYMLCKEKRIKYEGKEERPSTFKVDPAVKNGSTATDGDYTNSTYSRGHLCANEDMCWLREAQLETFYCSNISPQKQDFNAGIWLRLENLVRKWAEVYDTIYIVTGPVLNDEITDTIGKKNKITVPKHFYKVILNYTSNDIKGIGFIIPHEDFNNKAPLQDYAITIDSVQKVTGINFYHNLPNKHYEKKIETTLCEDCWIWK